MGRLFALADLHLSLTGDKPMDLFGEAWRDHPRRMARAWDAAVTAGDTVLLPGDLSWGRTLDEVAPDLRWIGERPGRKILLKGNHDGWWTSLTKVRRVLPPGCEPLHHAAVQAGGWVVVGARGWRAPDDPAATEADAAVYRRELGRLRLSLEDADRRFGAGRPRLAMTHYPPLLGDQATSDVARLLAGGGVSVCVYGHLHGEDHRLAVHGMRGGIRYVFVAADAVDFAPVLVLDGLAAPEGG